MNTSTPTSTASHARTIFKSWRNSAPSFLAKTTFQVNRTRNARGPRRSPRRTLGQELITVRWVHDGHRRRCPKRRQQILRRLLGATTGNVQGNVRGTFKECNSGCNNRLNQIEMDNSLFSDQCPEVPPSGSVAVRYVWQHNGPWVMSGRLRCQGVDSGRVPGGGILTGLYP